jgi:N4-gp56 family major capsid protein
MADTTTPSALTVKQWEDEFFAEYVRDNQFSPYMGTAMNSIIQVKEDLTKKKGDRIVLPFVTRLTNSGVTGNSVLEGNEEALDNYGFEIPVDVLRNAVVVTDFEEQKNAIDLRNAGREMLKFWAMEKLRGGGSTDEASTDATSGKFGIIDNLMSFYDGTTYSMYRDATEAVKDSWTANNSDRVLFGAAVSNNSSNDHSASLANIDDTADKLTATTLSLAKRLAKKADSRIRPVKTKGQEEWFIYFANSIAYRNLKADSTFSQATRESWVRGVPMMGNSEGNPLMRGGDAVYDGVIVTEIPELPYINNVGAGSIDVAPGFLCGAQGLGLAWAQRVKSTVNQEGGTDYQFRKGVGVMEMRGVRKNYANNKQWGVFTHYTSHVE